MKAMTIVRRKPQRETQLLLCGLKGKGIIKNLRPERTPVYSCLDCGMEITGFAASAQHIIEEMHRTVEVGRGAA